MSLSATSLTFAATPLNSPSASQTVTVTNTGTSVLNNILIVPSGNFNDSTNCGSSLAAGASCTISVTFQPLTVGTLIGAITITDSAPNSPQVISLTGGGADFSISATPTNTTVVAGNTTSVAINVTAQAGFNSAVNLTCTGMPSLATCTPSPAAVTPSSAGPATATLNISTTRRSAVPPGGLPRLPGSGLTTRPWMWVLAALLLLSLAIQAKLRNQRQWNWALLILTALWLASFAACGNGGNNYVDTTGTPAGTYTITVTGTPVAGTAHSTTFSLTVQ